MKLTRLWFRENEALQSEWTLDGLDVGNINLIVAKNATGKSRSLNVIYALAGFVSGKRNALPMRGHYRAEFEHDNQPWLYELKYNDSIVELESLRRGSEVLISRGPDGSGEIYAHELQRPMKFQTPSNVVAVAARRDSVQHPFLEPLAAWGEGAYHITMESGLGRNTLVLEVAGTPDDNDLSDATKVSAVFMAGVRKFPGFKSEIISDLASVGYPTSDVDLIAPPTVVIKTNFGNVKSLYIQETDIVAVTDQVNMSAGLWRCLAILIHVNYGIMSGDRKCLLIDDIGEGLDYERSAALIKTVIRKVSGSEMQLIMATNDRFVMNNVPIEYWTILTRHGSNVRCRNINNSSAAFDAFKFSGLSNFDFFSRDFIKLVDEH